MPRDGSGVLSAPAGTTATAGTTIESAKYNAFVADWVADGNTARPIVAGGTGATTAAAARTALGAQAADATLTSIAALGTAANKGVYTTGVDTWAEFDLTAAGRALLDDANAAAQRTTLGLGALATAASVTTAEIAAATLVTSSETIASNNNDTTIPTSAAVYAVSGRVLLASKTASSSVSLDFTEFNNSIYRYYEFELENVKPATDNVGLWARTSTDAGATYDAAALSYKFAYSGWSGAAAFGLGTGGDVFMGIGPAQGNAATERGVSGCLQLIQPGDAAQYTRLQGLLSGFDTASVYQVFQFSGVRTADQDTDALRFLMSSGNIASGVIRMYGVLK